jgi:AcrR family transcriptional regulator
MSPRKDVSDERRHQILDAAEQIFSDKGFDQARMDDIADRTGLSKGTLYLYFTSKEALITAILDRIFQREFREMEKTTDTSQSATDRLWQFTELACRDVTMMLRLMPIAYEFLALAFRNKLVQETLKQYFHRYMDILVPIIQSGIDSGEFKAVDAGEVALAAGAIFEGTILLWVYDNSMVEPVKHIHSSIGLLLTGIKARD